MRLNLGLFLRTGHDMTGVLRRRGDITTEVDLDPGYPGGKRKDQTGQDNGFFRKGRDLKKPCRAGNIFCRRQIVIYYEGRNSYHSL